MSTMTREELEQFIERNEVIKKTYPIDHPQYKKIEEHIAELKVRLSTMK